MVRLERNGLNGRWGGCERQSSELCSLGVLGGFKDEAAHMGVDEAADETVSLAQFGKTGLVVQTSNTAKP